jgi:predicted permease
VTSGFLISQIALCTVLLIGTGLFIRSLFRLNALDLGIDTQHVLVAQMDLRAIGYDAATIGPTYLQLAERLKRLPGVRSVSVAVGSPFYSSYGTSLKVPGLAELPKAADGGPYGNAVDENYFATLGMHIIMGRAFLPSDRNGGRVAIVNESMARRFWPGRSPIGQCLKVGGDTMPCSPVVGVVANARQQSLIEGETFQYFLPLESGPPTWGGTRSVFVSVTGSPDRFVTPVREAMQSAGSGLPYAVVRPMRTLLAGDFRPWDLGATMFSMFGGLALVLAAVGLYGSLAYDIAERRRELSVRMALGAQVADVVGYVMKRSALVIIAGLVIGVAATLAGARLIQGLLYGVSAHDPYVFLGVALTIAGAGALAAAIPSWRATRVDIRAALSSE